MVKSKDFKILYFSGTGNTKALAERLGEKMGIPRASIEEDRSWEEYLSKADSLVLMYPIHYSVPPMIFREFLRDHRDLFHNKKVVSIACQMCYSGDGGRVVEDFLPGDCEVVDTRHVNMPNNIPNIPFVPIASVRGNRRKTARALRKMDRIAGDLQAGRFKRRHISRFSRFLGEGQRKGGVAKEPEKKKSVKVSEACISCGLCVRSCPTKNFVLREKAVPLGNCSLCLRCENRCPVNAITVLIHRPVERKYPGPQR